MTVTLKQLRYFDALARELHFGKAAEVCAVTQPALSMQINELEQELGLFLVERTRTGIMLTKEGEEIARRVSGILSDVRELISFAKHSNKILSGILNLGLIPSVAPYILPPLLPLLREKFPDLDLHIRETQTVHLVHELLEGKLDVLLMALPIRHQDIEEYQLFKDPFLLALPKERKISGRVRASKEMIQNERLLLLEEGHCLRDQALAYCDLKQVNSINTYGATSLSTIVEMVAAGLGITLLPELSLAVEERGRALTLLHFSDPVPSRTIGLVWRTTSPRKQDYKELGRLVLEAWKQGPHKFASSSYKSQSSETEFNLRK